jgi:DNA replication protein DnaC
MRLAAFPVRKTLDEFDVSASSIPPATFDYLASLEWVRAAENVCLIGPAGTGKSHVLVALGVAAVVAGHRVRYFTAAELVETLYRGLADNSVGRVIDTQLRNDLIIVDLCRHRDYAEGSASLLLDRLLSSVVSPKPVGGRSRHSCG